MRIYIMVNPNAHTHTLVYVHARVFVYICPAHVNRLDKRNDKTACIQPLIALTHEHTCMNR